MTDIVERLNDSLSAGYDNLSAGYSDLRKEAAVEIMRLRAEIGSVRTGLAGRAIALLRLDRALAADKPLTAAGREVRLDPPPWLILPHA